jgi:hypothetical protein
VYAQKSLEGTLSEKTKNAKRFIREEGNFLAIRTLNTITERIRRNLFFDPIMIMPFLLVFLILAAIFVPYLIDASPEVRYQGFFLAVHMSLTILLLTEKRKIIRYAIGILGPFFAIGNFYWREYQTGILGIFMITSLSFSLFNCFNAFPD